MSASKVGALLLEKNYTLATAESCTGGLLSSFISEVAGASAWFRGGWVTYTNELKVSQLGVPLELLEQYGAVSSQVALAMASGASEISGSEVAVSITGIAGPTGGSDAKPVGTVCIACKVDQETQVREFRFKGERNEIRLRGVNTALQMLRLQLLGEQVKTMRWQFSE